VYTLSRKRPLLPREKIGSENYATHVQQRGHGGYGLFQDEPKHLGDFIELKDNFPQDHFLQYIINEKADDTIYDQGCEFFIPRRGLSWKKWRPAV
jgi:hypothetical protein